MSTTRSKRPFGDGNRAPGLLHLPPLAIVSALQEDGLHVGHAGGDALASPASRRALGFAAAAAGCRGSDLPVAVDAADLLIGLLLGNPDPENEASVLLTHLGLTARDVLPPAYPQLTAEDLRRQLRTANANLQPSLSAPIQQALQVTPPRELEPRDVLAGLLRIASPTEPEGSMMTAVTGAGADWSSLSETYESWLAESTGDRKPDETRSLRDALQAALPRRPVNVPTYATDRVGSDGQPMLDLVGIQREIDAFA